MYHYVRNPERTPYKNLHACREEDFIKQVTYLENNYQMADQSDLSGYLSGYYQPKKPMCVLTFDDGLKEHARFVTDVLSEKKIAGHFFLPTACLAQGYVLPVHKNHFLLATLDFDDYKNRFLGVLENLLPKYKIKQDSKKVAATYRWDKPKIAAFKYLLNYQLEKPIRNKVLKIVFEAVFGKEELFADDLYLNWEDAKSMQRKGMILGGHTHTHNVLSQYDKKGQANEIRTCMSLMKENTNNQEKWPFSYPFGKLDTFNQITITLLKESGVSYAFTSEVGTTAPKSNPFLIKRIDPKDVKFN